MSEHDDGQLSQFQLDLAAVFFSLPESVGFLLAGGGALIAQGLVRRDTDDLDFFANRHHGDVASAGDALIAAVEGLDWEIGVIRSGLEFRRFKISRSVSTPGGPDEVYVDLAVDSPPTRAPIVTIAGPALAPYETCSPQDPRTLRSGGGTRLHRCPRSPSEVRSRRDPQGCGTGRSRIRSGDFRPDAAIPQPSTR